MKRAPDVIVSFPIHQIPPKPQINISKLNVGQPLFSALMFSDRENNNLAESKLEILFHL